MVVPCYFLFIPINTAALGEGSNAFVTDNTAEDGKKALVPSMSNLPSCVRGHCAIPGLLCSLQQVTPQKSGLYNPKVYSEHFAPAGYKSDLRLFSGKGLQASHNQRMLRVTPRVLNQ